jgi:two-component system response regulator AtoC
MPVRGDESLDVTRAPVLSHATFPHRSNAELHQQFVAVLDSNRGVHSYLHKVLGERYRLSMHSDAITFSAVAAQRKPDGLVVAWDGVQTSVDFLASIRASWPETPLIVLTCVPDPTDYQVFANLGVSGILLKPFTSAEVEKVFQQHVPSILLAEDDLPEITLDQGHSFIRSSRQMRQIEAQAAMVARSDIPVLILGESGTGKEILALYTHKASLRANRMFMKINCAAMPAELLESELFGYEQGAFTGATKMKPGKFEICDRGTIFLDEIGEMPANLQAKLLQVLQDGTFSRLGGRTTIRTDVRIIAATNIDMMKAMAQKTFREDLYYRLNGISLRLPPLRERIEEIPSFANYFIRKGAKKYDLEPLPVSLQLLSALKAYPWPGNLREMENVINRYLVLGDEAPILSELTAPIRQNTGGNEVGTQPMSTGEGLKRLVRGVKGEAEKTAILAALKEESWNRKAAANALHISYKALLYKIKEYGIAPSSTWSERL